MWTPTTRRRHSRDHLRYGSDPGDAEWEIIAPFVERAFADSAYNAETFLYAASVMRLTRRLARYT